MKPLVVSALYQIPGSKRSINTYIERMIAFINSCNCNLVIFISQDLINLIPKSSRIIPIVLPIAAWHCHKIASDEEFNIQQIEYGKSIENPDISVDIIKLYHEKYNFVNRAIKLFPKYTYYLWTDIGCIHSAHTNLTKLIRSYPNIQCSEELGDRICFTLLKPIRKCVYDIGISHETNSLSSYIAGAIFLGNKSAWNKFDSIYKASLTYFKNNSLFWANDEHIYLHMLCKNPDNFTAIETFHKDIYCGMPKVDYKWIALFIILNLSYAGKIHFFKPPVERPQGFPNVRKAMWFSESKSADVTDTIRNIKELGPIQVMHTIFTEDPHPYHPKFLHIEYDDDRQQLVEEGDVFSPFLPYSNNGPDT